VEVGGDGGSTKEIVNKHKQRSSSYSHLQSRLVRFRYLTASTGLLCHCNGAASSACCFLEFATFAYPKMSHDQEFEELLKEVVNAKRLSASKMDKLTELAMKCMEVRARYSFNRTQKANKLIASALICSQNDTQIVTTLYRTHKTLPQSSKVSSLYVFDALARGARRQVTRLNLVADLKSPKGNCATFLLRLEGVLDSVFRDMISSGTDSGKVSSRTISFYPLHPGNRTLFVM